MLQPQVPVAREGVPFIGFAAFLTLVSAASECEILTFIFLLATAFTLYFFRDPERFVPDDPSALISPADGKIIVIEKTDKQDFIEGEALKISIFMNVFNVHVNRAPIAGKVDKIIYTPGKFYSADSSQGAEYNENCGIVLTTNSGKKIAFVQVAGLIARRIVCWLEPNDTIQSGRRVGLIRFGSRVDLYLPTDTALSVSVGDKVRAGETILGQII
ncbi:phosphatidylserine decarboxylase family protein [Desulfotalea psychrophila]|uniref:Phosphatidylserine decarboxylase proenzyme n=1 Tax=Desulfotalea psychrophila (strain LSv54 / DSM 12343) TaxID=177439 RepID=PSD_DESPS|nr:phosphatidylserine decarboxylase family protein [Desulfotalea psychrophila]Q6AJI0.1 RecName: Full=Phosphatidylserine decarboxylase proenzyme; Contains: RecName: Full=Phosphatidylserine decarboxylase alpha chain; Contains: RecName: Full=Phosphatidylserine decarboxylase beta chain [Desulfotalea psychrophila LSv54]CAG37500.1 probable phosphatidylserine decarboxylase [Desulfotalea psychrophila LSv54]